MKILSRLAVLILSLAGSTVFAQTKTASGWDQTKEAFDRFARGPSLLSAQVAKATNKSRIVIYENTVAFLTPSEKKLDDFLAKYPDREDGLIESLSDFFYHSEKLAPILRKAGLTVVYGSFGDAYFSNSSGEPIEIIVKENDIYAMAMLAKGESPKIVTNFGANIEPMTMIISEYFHIVIKHD